MESAAEKIQRNDGLLMEILVRLPPKSVFKSRCVSYRWNNIIVDPYFLKSYSAKSRKDRLSCGGERLLPFIQLLGQRKWLKMKSKVVPQRLGRFINSSNGLILCGKDNSKHMVLDSRICKKDTYYVLNPVTKSWFCLPLVPKNESCPCISIGLACEENTNQLVPIYTVVWTAIPVPGEEHNYMDIQIYSSKTGMWVGSTLVSTGYFSLVLNTAPLVWSGVFHWFTSNSIALYDLDDGENHLQLIDKPSHELDNGKYCDSSLTRSEFDDVLWYGDLINNEKMYFWMLPKNTYKSYRRSTTIPADEWVLMHIFTHDFLSKELEPPKFFLENNKKFRKNSISQSNFFSLEALIPYNPIIVVLRSGERFYLYNFERRSIEPVVLRDKVSWWYPFMETTYLSSYALRYNSSLAKPSSLCLLIETLLH